MERTVKVRRSQEWVRAERLRTGDNVDETIEVTVEVADLSEAARKVWLDEGGGTYRNSFCGPSGVRPGYSCYNHSENIVVDAINPTTEQIDLAIIDAGTRLAAWTAEKQAEYDARQAEKEAEQAAKLAREGEMAAARELLAEEIASLRQERNTFKQKRDTLAEFLSEVPLDALMGTARRVAGADSGKAVEAVIEKIEEASPIYIFERDED